MPLFAENEEKIFSDIFLEILNSTNITRTSIGGTTRALAEAVSKKMGRMWRQFDLNMVQAFLDGADGQFLNLIGDMMNVHRLGEQAANVPATAKNIRFYVNTGTFGDINSNNPISIPAGTIVSTAAGGEGIRYRVSFNTILSADDNEFFVSVQSTRTGSSVNVGVGELVHHNFIGYTDSSSSSLLVRNDAEIVQGQNVEGDVNYRYRIANQITASESANAVALRLAVLTVPGVADLVQIAYNRGIGTYDILIKSTSPSISTQLINTVQNEVDNVTAQGIDVRISGPIELGISLVGTLHLRNLISAQEETNLISNVTSNVTDYINNLDIGEELVINEIVERVMATSGVIKTLGQSNKPLDSISVWRPSRLEDNKVRSTLLADLYPDVDERIIVENRYAGDTPILFRTSV
jgi:hypothetical protein